MESYRTNTHCKRCQREHHSLFYLGPTENKEKTSQQPSSNVGASGLGKPIPKIDRKNSSDDMTCNLAVSKAVLLEIAKIKQISRTRETMTDRALNSASEASFVTEKVAQQLALRRAKQKHMKVSDLQGARTGQPKQMVFLRDSVYLPKSIPLPEAFILLNLTTIKVDQRIKKGN